MCQVRMLVSLSVFPRNPAICPYFIQKKLIPRETTDSPKITQQESSRVRFRGKVSEEVPLPPPTKMERHSFTGPGFTVTSKVLRPLDTPQPPLS